MVWAYRKEGKVLLYAKNHKVPRQVDWAWINAPFKERMVKALHHLECEQGSRFRVHDYSKDQLKRIWKDDH